MEVKNGNAPDFRALNLCEQLLVHEGIRGLRSHLPDRKLPVAREARPICWMKAGASEEGQTGRRQGQIAVRSKGSCRLAM